MLLFLFLGVVQVGMVQHVRNVLAADAAEGARHAASLGRARRRVWPLRRGVDPVERSRCRPTAPLRR
ncbi:MAG TPA: TadE family protein [Frankiaceae bacterium]|nr:TadE family protein [Frankiaceae bacterium]